MKSFFLQIKTSQLVYGGNKISWTSENNDIFIDPGEDVHFKVELLNIGSLNAEISSAIIDSVAQNDIYYYSITNNQVSFNMIESHDTSWCIGEFEISMVDDLAIYGTFPLKLKIAVEDDRSYEYIIYINNTQSPSNINFISDNSSITITWNAIFGAGGYNIYKLDPDDLPPGGDIEDSTNYQRLNLYVNQFSIFTDVAVESCKEYYYKLSCYVNDGLPQGPYTKAFKAWTTIPPLEPWPIFLPDFGLRSEGSPILYDVIHERDEMGNPELEIFFPMSNAENTLSAIYAFYSTGDELYNIDNNITTYAGFVNFTDVGIMATPIVGEMRSGNDYGEVAFTTTYGDSPNVKKLFLYSAGDEDPDPPDGLPDLLFEPYLDQPDYIALVGAKLIDGEEGEIKIITPEIGVGKKLDIRNTSDGQSSLGWPKEIDGGPDFGIPIAADIDLDGDKEIIVGVRNSDGVYVFTHDGQNYNPLNEPFFSPQSITGLAGLDCRPVVANLDASDVNPEIILLAAYTNNTAHVFALDYLGNEVLNWDYANSHHIINISTSLNGNYPALTVADLNGDGILEVIVADAGKVNVWKANGDIYNEQFPIEVPGLKCPAIAPLVANVDNDSENEIIIASSLDNDFIYAFNPDGSQVPGWPLIVEGLIATPAIGDVNHDGLNEIVAVYGGYVNVWKTEGETGHDQWPLYRLNSFNNAAYEEPACDYDPNNPLIISSNEPPWIDYRKMNCDIVVPQNVTLTITGRVAMPDDSKIIIERGGKLSLIGGVITSACGGFWDGIQVWGYSDKSQFDPLFHPGEVELTENAVIENARIAIATIKTVNGVTISVLQAALFVVKTH